MRTSLTIAIHLKVNKAALSRKYLYAAGELGNARNPKVVTKY